MIAVTGATGHLGRLVVASLLREIPASEIVAVARDEKKAADLAASGVLVRKADYERSEGWDAALDGVAKLLLVSSSEIGRRAAHHRTVVDAAKRTGVSLLAYTSVLHADTSELGLAGEHRETEEYIRASGLPFVFLRNGWYTENHTAGIHAALSAGAVFGCAGNGRFSTAARTDYAQAAVVALTAGDFAGRILELAGDTSYTLAEFAAELSKRSGRTIPYVDLPEAEYRDSLLAAGIPGPYAELLANSDACASRGALFDEGRELSRLIERPTTPLTSVVVKAMSGGYRYAA